MKLINLYKSWLLKKKALTITISAVVGAMIIAAIVICSIVIAKRNPHSVEPTEAPIAIETKTPPNTEKEDKKEPDTEEISQEEYYELEEALDDDASNEEYEESVPVGDRYPYYIKVNRLMNTVTVYSKDENGEYTIPVKAMVCSCGLYNGTPTGIFRTSTKYTWRYLYGNVYGQYAFRIKGPILFHSVPYVKQDKGTLEAEEFNKLGDFASLGCVRLAVKDCKWLVDNCPSGTMVEIYDDPNPGPLGKPSMIKIDVNSPCAGWDPTDPSDENPWRSTPPTIYGVANKTIERGDSFQSLANISAMSMDGEALTVSVSGSVDVNTVGCYTLTYTATDAYGYSSTASATITVRDTKKPALSVSAENNTIDITDDDTQNLFDLAAVETTIHTYLSASDGGFSAEAIIYKTGAESMDWDSLVAAIESHTSGSFSIQVYARDSAGNISLPVTLTINYTYTTTPTE